MYAARNSKAMASQAPRSTWKLLRQRAGTASAIANDHQPVKPDETGVVRRQHCPIVLEDVVRVVEIGAEADPVREGSHDAFHGPPEPAPREMVRDDDVATGAADAADFRDQSLRVWRHRQDIRNSYAVETVVGEIEALRVHYLQMDLSLGQRR